MTTIADVAAHAGVGVGTVSRVLTGHRQVSPETRELVLASIEALHYKPSRSSARRSERSGFVGVVVPFFDAPSVYPRIQGIVARLQTHGLNAVLYDINSPDMGRKTMFDLPHSNTLSGLIVISLPLLQEEAERLAAAPFPTILTDTRNPLLASVTVDDTEGGRLATSHLISMGHVRIAFVGEPIHNPFGFVSSRFREDGYRAALTEAGIEVRPTYIRHAAHLRTAARQQAMQLLALQNPPTAIVAASDMQALGVMEAISACGLDSPGDVSVIGYDDIDVASHVGLSTIRQPLIGSGDRSASLLLEALANGGQTQAFDEHLAVDLVVRSTTGPPPEPADLSQRRQRSA
jgi:DNA-binding LacI/PurR family transcriptional regulator